MSAKPLTWSDARTWDDPEHTMPDGYFIRAEPYTVCKVGSADPTDPTGPSTRWRFEIWRGTQCLKTDCTCLSDARRWAERHHQTHGHEPVNHDRE
jgi:hypothetical protein